MFSPEEFKKIIYEAVQEALANKPSAWPRWLPIKEASRYSGLSAKTLRKLAKEGEIYAVESPGGGKLLFDRESIDDYFLREKAKFKTHFASLKKELFKSGRIW